MGIILLDVTYYIYIKKNTYRRNKTITVLLNLLNLEIQISRKFKRKKKHFCCCTN